MCLNSFSNINGLLKSFGIEPKYTHITPIVTIRLTISLDILSKLRGKLFKLWGFFKQFREAILLVTTDTCGHQITLWVQRKTKI